MQSGFVNLSTVVSHVQKVARNIPDIYVHVYSYIDLWTRGADYINRS